MKLLAGMEEALVVILDETQAGLNRESQQIKIKDSCIRHDTRAFLKMHFCIHWAKVR